MRPCEVNNLFLIRKDIGTTDGILVVFLLNIFVVELYSASSYILQYMKITVILCVNSVIMS